MICQYIKHKTLWIVAVAATAGMVACGDSGTTEQIINNTSGMEIVGSYSDLPKCTSENTGDQALVKEDGVAYYCSGKEWKVLGGSAGMDTIIVSNTDTVYVSGGDSVYVSGGDFACTTKPLTDESGIKIVCNGDSIGVVLNGKDGTAGAAGKDGVDG